MATALVTGANRGIGLELTRQLKVRGDDVIAVCRNASRELEALGVRLETGVDVSDDASVAALPERLAGANLDVLINNAGILSHESLDRMDFASIERQFEVNALAPLRVTTALLPLMNKPSKVAII